jgi:H+-translocating NAD(P) transhydrogenase subunit beta
VLSQNIVNIAYLISAMLFIFGLKGLAHPRTAVRGNRISALGMLLAIVATLLSGKFAFHYIILGVAIGSVLGAVSAMKVKMTAMPEMVGLFNGFGGAASVLVAGSALIAAMQYASTNPPGTQMKIAIVASGIIGSVTFFGSYVAFGKLAEFLAVKWKLHPWQKVVKYGFSLIVAVGAIWFGVETVEDSGSLLSIGVILSGVAIGGLLLLKKDRFAGMNVFKGILGLITIVLGVLVVLNPWNTMLFWLLVGTSGVLGVLLTFSIGGADMPVVIALLNSYSGLAATATGFVINNNVLIISGSLVGASGIILTNIMCKAMNRSLTNVLFGVMGPTGDTPSADDVYGGKIKATSAEEIAMLFEGARRVVIVPGYGMAVAQAQHAVNELATLLEKRDIDVAFAIHPVAGRMPGHMNVLLAEANVPYDKLLEMDEANPTFLQTDVAIVLGANDVVNPVARTDPKSPIAGMPIIDVDKARTVVVIKRSLSPGFAGIPNPLFAMDNTLMFFSDGKKVILDIIAAVKEM